KVDDRAAAPRQQRRDRRLAHEECGLEVDGELPIERLWLYLGKRPKAEESSRDVHQDVEAAELRLHGGGGRLRRLGLRKISRGGLGGDAVGRKLLDPVGEPDRGDIREQQLGAG